MTTIQVGSWEEETDGAAVRAAVAELKTNPDRAMRQLESFAENGSLKSMLYLADAYMRGKVTQKNLEKAGYWYRQLGARGVVFGTHMAASMEFKLKDFDTARVEFWRSAEAGFLPSIYRKGYMLSEGIGCTKDLMTGVETLRNASSRGHFGAALYHARLLRQGAFGIAKMPLGMYLSILWRCRLIAATIGSRGSLVTDWDDRYIL